MRALCIVAPDEERIETAIQQECRYVLATTDGTLTAQQIVERYKGNSLIE